METGNSCSSAWLGEIASKLLLDLLLWQEKAKSCCCHQLLQLISTQRCAFAGYSWPLEGSDELQTTQAVLELDVLFHDMFVLYHQTTTTKRFFFFSASRIFKLAAAAQRWKVDELRGGWGQQQERQQKQRVAGVGVSVDVLPLRHTFFRGLHHHSSQTIYCGEVRCEAPIKLSSPLRKK